MWPNGIVVLTVLLISSTLVTGDGVKGEKEGVCPADNIRCFRSEDPQCSGDSDCGDQQICCYWHCGFKCVPPVKDNGEQWSPQE